MSFRNLSPQEMFVRLAMAHRPTHAFGQDAHGDFPAWKSAALPAVLATLGDFPARVPPNPRLLAEWEHDGLLKQRWLIDVQEYLSATLLVNIPGESPNGQHPAILCWHGHDPGDWGR